MLPQDPIMLLSVVNMKLRDFYQSLDALCEDMNVSKDDIVSRLRQVGYEYSEEERRFV